MGIVIRSIHYTGRFCFRLFRSLVLQLADRIPVASHPAVMRFVATRQSCASLRPNRPIRRHAPSGGTRDEADGG